jgi:hypothetical protein
MGLRHKIADWIKYERLEHYPALARLPKPEALKLLKECEAEERNSRGRALRLFYGIVGICFLTMAAISLYHHQQNSRADVGLTIVAFALDYLSYRRLRKRVNARIEAQIKNGQTAPYRSDGPVPSGKLSRISVSTSTKPARA